MKSASMTTVGLCGSCYGFHGKLFPSCCLVASLGKHGLFAWECYGETRFFWSSLLFLCLKAYLQPFRLRTFWRAILWANLNSSLQRVVCVSEGCDRSQQFEAPKSTSERHWSRNLGRSYERQPDLVWTRCAGDPSWPHKVWSVRFMVPPM